MITDDCVSCGFCMERFECPALFRDEKVGHTMINEVLCSGCAVCVGVCPKGAIVIAGEDK
ncbi:MAG: hypothetical protein COZ70_08050 [Deltaproteobacteria bacterium CG_4_8_14_3_um_filter_51_11]|nr:MAG: hypothetical protein COZ70_08050 [Deltaproteobacteria bacterium CG_4_8_14_3_um_filter_51_11]